MTASLPVINYGEKDRGELSRQVVHSMKTMGFMFLENVPNYDEDELRWCVDFFFGLPQSKKLAIARRKYNPDSKLTYRGYLGTDRVGSSYKEMFEIGKDFPTDDPHYKAAYPISEHSAYPEPDPGEDPAPYNKYRDVMTRYYEILYDVSTDLLQLIAKGLGLGEHYFDALFTKSISTFRLINYPVHDFKLPADAYGSDGQLQSTAPHCDTSILTLLSTFDYEGLQIENKDKTWLDVVPRKQSLVVNLGDILCRMTDYKVKATIHRVLAIGRPRQSAAFFYEPSFFSMLPQRLPKKGEDYKSIEEWPETECVEYGPFMVKYIQRFVEHNGLLGTHPGTFKRPVEP